MTKISYAPYSSGIAGDKLTYDDLLERLKQVEQESADRKFALQKLEKKQNEYEALVENANSIIIRLDTNGRIVFLNEYAQSFLGFTKEEVLGHHPVGSIVPETDSAGRNQSAVIRHLILNPDLYLTNENENIKKNGERVWIAWTNKAIRDKENNVLGILCVGNDVSDRKRDEQEFKSAYQEMENHIRNHSQDLEKTSLNLKQEISIRKKIESELVYAKLQSDSANLAKAEFLANMSHELRTPLHHILTFAKFALDKIKQPDDEIVEYLCNIRESGYRLKDLLDDLLDLTYLEEDKIDFNMTVCDLQLIVDEAIEWHQKKAEQKKVKIVVRYSTLNTVIECDQNLIRQVARKLVTNAIKYTPEGKTITINFEPHMVTYSGRGFADREIPGICVHMKDQGIGVPETELESIFEKFTQSSKTKTGAGGKGLGLSICQLIIKAHHGEIWAENNPDQGATFSFAIPNKQPDSEPDTPFESIS